MSNSKISMLRYGLGVGFILGCRVHSPAKVLFADGLKRQVARTRDGSGGRSLAGRTLAQSENEMNSAERRARMCGSLAVLPKIYASCSLYRLVTT
jgi:hypothetical protein